MRFKDKTYPSLTFTSTIRFVVIITHSAHHLYILLRLVSCIAYKIHAFVGRGYGDDISYKIEVLSSFFFQPINYLH